MYEGDIRDHNIIGERKAKPSVVLRAIPPHVACFTELFLNFQVVKPKMHTFMEATQ